MPYPPLLVVHASAGGVALLTGTVAVCVRKGSQTHARAGIVFSVAMLTLAASGTYLGALKSQTGNVIGGLATFYMVATAWMAGRPRTTQRSPLDWVGLLFALTLMTGCFVYGFGVASGRRHAPDGVPAAMDFFFGTILLLAAIGDIRMLARSGFVGSQRIARHLWRMCFALFVASGSFFMGRQRLFPIFIQRSFVLELLTVLPLLLMIFWLVRVRFKPVFVRKVLPVGEDVYSRT